VIAVTPDNNIYVLDYIHNRTLPVLGIPGTRQKGIVDYIFDYAKFYNPTLFTIEDTSMSKPIFQAIRAEMRRRNEFIIPFKEEKPGNRMSKRDRIQEILAQRFAFGTCILDVFSHVKFFQNFQYVVPLCITLFFFSFPLVFISQIYKYIYSFIFLSLFFSFLVEAIKITNKKLNIFKIVIIFYLGIIFFGLGSMMRILGLKINLRKIYTFRN